MTFSAITVALVLGELVERMKFSAVRVFAAVWLTITYYPIAHMVWYAGADAASTGLIFGWGALDFAGGTVVHINAGVAGLVGCLLIGKSTVYQRENLARPSLTRPRMGTDILGCGGFGFTPGRDLYDKDSGALREGAG